MRQLCHGGKRISESASGYFELVILTAEVAGRRAEWSRSYEMPRAVAYVSS